MLIFTNNLNKTPKILVTGAAGFIGSHTMVELQQAGYQVIGLDNFENSSIHVADQISSITGTPITIENIDIRNKKALIAFVQQHKDIHAVIHFAAYKAVGESVQFPTKYYENNVGGTANLLDAMAVNDINSIVFSSSCTVYGEANPPVDETTPVQIATSPYGNTKQICEELLRDQNRANGLNVISLRYFNPVGAHDSALIGELPLGIPNNLVPFITQTAIGKRKQLTVFGNDYPTPDGTCIRDYIHVVDLAKAHLKALEYQLAGKNQLGFDVFNLGTGKGSSVLEVVAAFEKVSGQHLNMVFGPRRAGDVVQVYAACDKANKALGWKTERNLENCMQTAWAWEQALAKMENK